jgi:hypothetical protein
MTTSCVTRLTTTVAGGVAALALLTALAGCGAGNPGAPAEGASSPASTASTNTAGTSGGSSGGSSGDIDACSLLSIDQATTLVAKYPYSAATPSTIAPGQDQCTYANTGPLPDMTVIVYQSDSGVSFPVLTDASGATASVSGVGDKAASGDIELDVQAGDRLIAIQAAGGVGFDGSFTGAIAVAKAVIAALG